MKTLNKIMIAATVAMTVGTASAAIPGLPAGFDFTNSGADLSNGSVGLGAITDINEILDAVGDGTSGGSVIDKDNFWKSFMSKDSETVFEYSKAVDFIEELVFTVNGEVWVGSNVSGADSNGYVEANSNQIQDQTAKASSVGTGTEKRINGQLRATGVGASTLLESIGFTKVSSMTGAFGEFDDATNTLTSNPMSYADPSTTSVKSKLVDGSLDVSNLISNARLSEKGFNNANALIAKIAELQIDSVLLDVVKATAAVRLVIDQHNGFLGASISLEAKKLKDVIKSIALQSAAADIGKTVYGICSDSSVGATGTACTKLGSQFVDISSEIKLVNASTSDYVSALSAIEGFATDLIAFNDAAVAGTFSTDGAAEAATILGEFGNITVANATVDAYNLLSDSEKAWTTDSAFDIDLDSLAGTVDFTSEVTFVTGVDSTTGADITETHTIK